MFSWLLPSARKSNSQKSKGTKGTSTKTTGSGSPLRLGRCAPPARGNTATARFAAAEDEPSESIEELQAKIQEARERYTEKLMKGQTSRQIRNRMDHEETIEELQVRIEAGRAHYQTKLRKGQTALQQAEESARREKEKEKARRSRFMTIRDLEDPLLRRRGSEMGRPGSSIAPDQTSSPVLPTLSPHPGSILSLVAPVTTYSVEPCAPQTLLNADNSFEEPPSPTRFTFPPEIFPPGVVRHESQISDDSDEDIYDPPRDEKAIKTSRFKEMLDDDDDDEPSSPLPSWKHNLDYIQEEFEEAEILAHNAEIEETYIQRDGAVCGAGVTLDIENEFENPRMPPPTPRLSSQLFAPRPPIPALLVTPPAEPSSSDVPPGPATEADQADVLTLLENMPFFDSHSDDDSDLGDDKSFVEDGDWKHLCELVDELDQLVAGEIMPVVECASDNSEPGWPGDDESCMEETEYSHLSWAVANLSTIADSEIR